MRSPNAARFGAVISFVDGKLVPLPFEEIVNPMTGRMKPRKVDIASETYECARPVHASPEKSDFEEPQLSRLAHAAGMPAENLRRHFGIWPACELE